MSKKDKDFINYNSEPHIDDAEEFYRPGDHSSQTNGSDFAGKNDSINQANEFPSNKIYQDNVHGREINKNGPTPKGKRHSASVIPVVLLTAATSGGGIIGITTILANPTFDVNLFSKSETSLIFEVKTTQVDNDDLVLAQLYTTEDLVSEIELVNLEKYVTFGDLLPDTQYNLKILYGKDHYFQDSEGNYIHIDESPVEKFSSNYFTAATYYNVYASVMEYSTEMLAFVIYNMDDRIPYVTAKVSFGEKEVFVKDQSASEQSYEIHDIPYNTKVYITVKYQDKGLDVISLEAIGEPIRITYSPNIEDYHGTLMPDDYGEANKYFTLSTCTYTIQGHVFAGWALTPDGEAVYSDGQTIILGDEDLTLYAKWNEMEYSTIYFNGNGADSGTMSPVLYPFGSKQNLPANAFIKNNNIFQGWSLTAGGSVVYEDEGEITIDFESIELFASWQPNEYSISKDSANCLSTFDSITAAYVISDPSMIDDLEIYFDGILVDSTEYSVNSDGEFAFTMTNLSPETSYEITMVSRSTSASLFNETIETDYLVNPVQVESNTITLTFSDSFMDYASMHNMYAGIIDSDNYYFLGSTLITTNTIDATGIIYEGTYKVEIENDSSAVIYSKSFETYGPIKPDFSILSGSNSSTFDSVTFKFNISDVDKADLASIHFDGVELNNTEYSVDSDGVFTVTKDNLSLESEHLLEVFDSHGNLIYDDTKVTSPVLNITQEESSIVKIDIDSEFNTYTTTVYDTQFSYFIYDSNGVNIIEDEFGGEIARTYNDRILFLNETYTLKITQYDFNTGDEYVLLTKTVELTGTYNRPDFTITPGSGMSIIIEYVSGDIPEYGMTSFDVVISKGTDYECTVEYVYFSSIGDKNTIDLNDGGLNGAVGSSVLSPDSGTYTVKIQIWGYTFYTGTVTIA